MSKVYLERDTLVDIADAIRAKTGSQDTMKPSEMAEEVGDIPGASDYFDCKPQSFSQYFVRDRFIKSLPTIDITNTTISFGNIRYFCAGVHTLIIPKIICGSNITYMSDMYNGCDVATSIDVSGLNTSNVTDMQNMFVGCEKLTSLDLSNFVTNKVSRFDQMFYNCKKLAGTLDLSNFEFNQLNTYGLQSLFYNCNELTAIILPSNFNPKCNFIQVFTGCSKLTSIDLSEVTGENTTDCSSLFNGCNSLTQIDMRKFDFTSVSSKYNMFGSAGYGVPNACLIIVKDDTQKSWMNTNFSRLTNVQTVEEYEASQNNS